jgi:hypothetical protein
LSDKDNDKPKTEAEADAAPDFTKEPVPQVPNTWRWKFSTADIIRILMFAALLFGVLATREGCGKGMAKFIGTFEEPPDAGPKLRYERLTHDEIRARFSKDAGPKSEAVDKAQ